VTPAPESPDLGQRLEELDRVLGRHAGIVVAFSGGADSAFLLAAATRAQADVLAVTSTSASLASGEWAAAAGFAARLGVEHLRLDTDELQREGYAANGADRCYHCKSELLDRLLDVAQQRGFSAIATGTNADDVQQPHRPGLRAADERGVITPLADVGMTKADIRAASRLWALPTWDKPQAACLASRIAYGVRVDADRLARVDRAETAVRFALAAAGIDVVNLRVRDLGDQARIEVDPEAVSAAVAEPSVVSAAVAAGFASADVDARGFRSGSLNETLLPQQLTGATAARSSWRLPLLPQ
jgi:uncharacterized protein